MYKYNIVVHFDVLALCTYIKRVTCICMQFYALSILACSLVLREETSLCSVINIIHLVYTLYIKDGRFDLCFIRRYYEAMIYNPDCSLVADIVEVFQHRQAIG